MSLTNHAVENSYPKMHVNNISSCSEIREKIKSSGAKFVTKAYNFDSPYQSQVSSIHLFDSNIMYAKGLHEVGCYMPCMRIEGVPMSGWSDHDRFNGMDVAPLYEIIFED